MQEAILAEIEVQPALGEQRHRFLGQASGLLNRDIYVIGGAKTFQTFVDIMERWIVTEVPLTVDDADTFMPENFLNEFNLLETKEIEDGLKVKFLQRK